MNISKVKSSLTRNNELNPDPGRGSVRSSQLLPQPLVGISLAPSYSYTWYYIIYFFNCNLQQTRPLIWFECVWTNHDNRYINTTATIPWLERTHETYSWNLHFVLTHKHIRCTTINSPSTPVLHLMITPSKKYYRQNLSTECSSPYPTPSITQHTHPLLPSRHVPWTNVSFRLHQYSALHHSLQSQWEWIEHFVVRPPQPQ